MDRRPLSTFTRRGARSPLIRALAGFALCAATTLYANDESGQTSLEAALTEAATSSGSANISWLLPTQNADKTALTDLAGILICYGTSASDLGRCSVANGGSATNYTVTGLSAGTWYFVAQAFTTEGGLSSQTPTVSKTIP
jgi:hypothetical protein